MNDLLREYTGPVLIAQGALDPLNNAPARAKQFEGIRPGVWVRLLDLGHCPMDEGPGQMAASVVEWARERGIVKGGEGVDVGGVRAGAGAVAV